ncbi:putative GDP-perosamine synthase [Candidatus Kuenenia stuttgartiensis]|jgi:perosamine synthetase|uniref:Putative GDP-perosamine synthase n=1 Tax=Kuenenia stuttgartiensis TaxID=174633 RepID=A0A2C9CI96_KUEST|nr:MULTISPECIES: DegT/DnrJ/EryC1/StrS family aminotransferase [Kuenenia]MBW7941307.1 DegT/DnrJ/EryC1/StrS family aminotransferase [Candidatus Kuenenia stuttgartiensis]MBZ0191878.1 DegT/DnrJ/EryC1/StrS family aminotransferase [Candidatus Kuenenia stuttgartiensis]MCF6152964.1 DegT/DnrJ/EryC1/StrS family aminotransferase [Candidatus Kuenenia stuttgartiensis]MCL4727047.1 DegT/DnrJ/EryC1/StrS family aminotransferase [Candidatus Kuenenia stuttgartiensis]MCZ7623548.1 DegT/DnrJ/EryC1/StrS family amino
MIPVNEPLLTGNEKKYLAECIDTGWISSEGPFVRQFEQGIAARVSRRHGIAVSNGSVALEAAVAALGIGEGDEVIIPTFTIISCAAAVVRAGAMPVLIDSDPITWNIDAEKLKIKLKDEIDRKGNKKIKAIMVVHIYGLPVDMEPILELAEKYRLLIIEDAAEMLGQTYKGQPCGSYGDISTMSFYPNKHVTTGEGGMILTDSDALAEKCRSLRNLCFLAKKRFVHEELGWNFRMTNLQAAVGIAQMEQLDVFVIKKRKMGQKYTELLSDIKSIDLPVQKTDYAENIYWVYGIVLKDEIPFDAEEAMKRLGEKGIGTRPFFWPMHEQPVFKKMGFFKGESHPVAERISRRGFYIPSGLALTDNQINEVSRALHEVLA